MGYKLNAVIRHGMISIDQAGIAVISCSLGQTAATLSAELVIVLEGPNERRSCGPKFRGKADGRLGSDGLGPSHVEGRSQRF